MQKNSSSIFRPWFRGHSAQYTSWYAATPFRSLLSRRWQQVQFLESAKALSQQALTIHAIVEAGLPGFDGADEDRIYLFGAVGDGEVGQAERFADELMHIGWCGETLLSDDRSPLGRKLRHLLHQRHGPWRPDLHPESFGDHRPDFQPSEHAGKRFDELILLEDSQKAQQFGGWRSQMRTALCQPVDT